MGQRLREAQEILVHNILEIKRHHARSVKQLEENEGTVGALTHVIREGLSPSGREGIEQSERVHSARNRCPRGLTRARKQPRQYGPLT